MTSTKITKMSAMGQAWEGDWHTRITERIRTHGFQSIASFAEAHPTASMIALAQELSTDYDARLDRADVAAEQLANLWRSEAMEAGPKAQEYMARRILVGELHRALSAGWLHDWTADAHARASASELAGAGSAWVTYLPDEHRDAARRVFSAMLDEGRARRIPHGWLPASVDDMILDAIFTRHWGDPSESSGGDD